MLSSTDGIDGGAGGLGMPLDYPYRAGPSTAAFLRHAQIDPVATGFHVTPAVVSQLHRSIWSSIFQSVPPACLLPREVAPSAMHALLFLERCGWKLGAAQKQAAFEVNERRKEALGSLASSSTSTSSTASPAGSPRPSNSKPRVLPFPRQATPPPGVESDEPLGADYGIDRKGLPCGHIFKKGETIYRCRDCALDDTCVLCAPCFNASNHEGHNIVFSVSDAGGGCCDCGDDEAWKRPLQCKYHSAEEHGDNSVEGEAAMLRSADGLDEEMEDINESKGKAPERPRSRDDSIEQVDKLLKGVPADTRTALVDQISRMIAFVLDTMEHAPAKMKLEDGPDALQEIKKQKTLQPAEPDEQMQDPTATAVGAYTFDSSSQQRLYAVLLWNDEKHSFREVIDIVSEATGKSEADSKGVADRIDRHGREIIEISSEVRRLYLLAHKLGQIDLAVTIRPAYDVFAEEIAGHILSFLLDLANASFLVTPPASQRQPLSTHPFGDLVPSAAVMRSMIARALLNPWQHHLPISSPHMTRDYFDERNLLHLDGLLLMDHKMWKSGRANLTALYMALIGPREVKRAFSLRFAAVFPKIVETFILYDREPEHSVRYVAVQIFSVPSVATELVATQNLLFKMLQMLQSIYDGQTSRNYLTLPPEDRDRTRPVTQSMLVRQTRCHPILQDLKYLLAAEGVQQQIAQDVRHLQRFADFLVLFTSILPESRAVGQHVEFESELWIPVVHMTTYLAYLAKLFGEAYVKADTANLNAMIIVAARRALDAFETVQRQERQISISPCFGEVDFAKNSHEIVRFKVESDPVSFYHPMHWLVAEMLKTASRRDSATDGGGTTVSGFGECLRSNFGESGILALCEPPLRVIVKLKQIRAGLWVRNGFGVRSQAHHYKDNNFREVTLDQDLFMLQVALAECSPDRVLVTFVDRFSLLKWLQRIPDPSSSIDSTQTLAMAEEFMLTLVTLLSETSMAAKWSVEDQIRRELIHFLALSQGTYSEITRYISDRLKDHASFERVLREVSQYRAPDGSNDLGIFVLRPELLNEVDPYFLHYTRNQREKAEQVLKDRNRRLAPGEDADSFVVVPSQRLGNNTHTILRLLSRVFVDAVFTRIMSYALKNIFDAAHDVPDGLLDAVLQLLMMGFVEQGKDFAARLYSEKDPDTEEGALDILCKMREDKRFLPSKAKISWILDSASTLDEASRSHLARRMRSDQSTPQPSTGPSQEEKRRAAAKARQAAIMQQFSQQQQSLLDSLEDDDDSDEDLPDGPTEVEMRDSEASEVKKIVFGNCIFCQENLHASDSFGCLAHVQGSRIVRVTPRHDASSLQQSLQVPLTLDRNGKDGKRMRVDSEPDGLREQASAKSKNWEGFPNEERRFGFYTSSCGHLMHLTCFESYSRTTELRHIQQIARNHPEDLSRSEFVCPLCKSLGNVVLPVAQALQSTQSTHRPLDTTPLPDWIRKINIDILKTPTRQLRDDMQELEYGTGCFTHWFADDANNVLEHFRSIKAAPSADNALARMLDRLCSVLKPLSQRTRSSRSTHQSKTILSSPNRKMYIPEEVVAYTISVLEIAQRGKSPSTDHVDASAPASQTTVADAISEGNLDLIVSLVQCLNQLVRIEYADYDSVLRHGLMMRLLPQWGGHDAVRAPLLMRDPLTVLVEAAVIMPEALRQITVIMFYVQLVQVIFGIAQPSLWPQGGSQAHTRISAMRSASRRAEVDESSVHAEGDTEALATAFDDVRGTVSNIIGLVGYARGNITLGVDNLDDTSLAKMICTYCLPFLRRAAILQKSMDRIIPGLSSPKASASTPPNASEFMRLMTVLDIPLPREALSANATRQTALAGLVEGSIKHAYPKLASIFRPLPLQPSPLSSSSKAGGQGSHHQHQHGVHPTLQLEYPHIYELIRLPKTLTTLLTQCQSMRCKRCADPPPEPAVCLECGELLCFQNFCCQGTSDGRGECNLHLDECGHSSGMFFKIKSNIIVLLYQGKGCFTYSPYLDLHGEIDVGLKKGKIQTLHTARFDELRKQWLQHSLPNMIARKTEAVMDQGGWTTM